MRTLGTFATLLSSICAAQSAFDFTSVPSAVHAGQPYAVQYAQGGTNEQATITLRKGAIADPQSLTTLTTSATNGSYLWLVPDYLEDASDYALEIIKGAEVNHSGEFTISGSTLMAASASADSEPIIATYRASLQDITAMPMAEAGSAGTAMAHDATYSSATPRFSSTADSGAGATSNTKSRTVTGSRATGATPAASNAAAVRAVSAISGASPLALVFCVFAGMLL